MFKKLCEDFIKEKDILQDMPSRGIHFIFSVKDRITGEFNPPWSYVNVNIAKQMANEGMQNAKYKQPSDFSLYILGFIDIYTGEIYSHQKFVMDFFKIKESEPFDIPTGV